MTSSAAITVDLIEGAVDSIAPDPTPPHGGGGHCAFAGYTRAEKHPVHGDLICLDYDCYRDMARDELKQLAAEAASRFGAVAVSIIHAVGRVDVGQASVRIDVVCPHRDEAFLACRFLIDTLKSRVPIWKREVWSDGSTWRDGVPI
ncbi:MAG: molybdenum cofactor biosynthesis protein MoaE [Phycisphaerales bacterium]|jgi:molybdopterin synthase catalytic subunit|nr:molybdenum cofactor biosynthesis protein MoaE [Phycisphaerales bacterium]MDP6987058.1 molybdenum cofactor biosynthesis protein MoaE [Phycisphaerales bacterium]